MSAGGPGPATAQNATLAATLSHLTDNVRLSDDPGIRLRTDLTREM